EPSLQGYLIDFDDYAVDLVVDIVSVLIEIGDEVIDVVGAFQNFRVFADRQAPRMHRLIGLVLTAWLESLAVAQTVTHHRLGTLCGLIGVCHSQGPGRGVAWVGVRRFPRIGPCGIDLIEVCRREIRLAAHLDYPGYWELLAVR